MIRNIVFDMGQVLVRFDPEYFIRLLDVPEADGRLLMREVFLSREWARKDWGAITDEASVRTICTRLPERLHGHAARLVTWWELALDPIEGMYELVRELKRAGYGVYLLSNATFRQHEYWREIPCHAFFDGALISCDVGSIKPERAIYEAFLEKFGLLARECFFVDDAPNNVEGACRCGMSGAVFHGDAAELRERMREAGIMVGPA